MKKINLSIAALAIVTSICGVNAEQTTTTTESSYTYSKDGDNSITGTKKMVTAERNTDKEILKLLDGKIDGYSDLDDAVSFKVEQGVVTFKGRVKYLSQKDHVGLIAESISGVTRVDNLIDIK